MHYAVLDIEATGGKAGTEKIIDIYIYRFDGERIIDQFGSMVRPERGIDKYVQKLTGITDKMVKSAPRFHELAKRIVEITEDCIIVGHGVEFDYRMLKQEFGSLGYQYQRPTMDTLTLSKVLIPDAESHSLGKLGKSLGIPTTKRHRAEGDTKITLELFKILLKKDTEKNIIQTYAQSGLNIKEKVAKLLNLEENLPETAGVYYFHNQEGRIFYANTARNIALSVNKDFTNRNSLNIKLQSNVQRISYELTGSFAIALLKYTEEVASHKKWLKPKFDYFSYGIYVDKDNFEFQNKLFVSNVNRQKKQAILLFSSKKEAYKKLNEWRKEYNFQEPKSSFNAILKKIKERHNFPHKNFLIIDKGRNREEKSFIEIKNNKVKAYGYFRFHNQIEKSEIREKITTELKLVHKNRLIIKSILQSSKSLKIIQL